jgi:hypothetical protein
MPLFVHGFRKLMMSTPGLSFDLYNAWEADPPSCEEENYIQALTKKKWNDEMKAEVELLAYILNSYHMRKKNI